MIVEMLFCGVGATLTLGLALYDFGYTSVGIGQSIAKAAQRVTAEQSLLRSLYLNATTLMDDGYDSLEVSHSNETWWPVAAGVRASVDERLDGTQLINRAYNDAELIYRNDTWWPAVSALRTAFLNFQSTDSNGEDVADYGAIWQKFLDLVGDPVEFFTTLGETATAVSVASVSTVSSAAFLSIGSMMSIVNFGSQWAISTFTFLLLLLPTFMCMETDALDVLVSSQAI